MKKIIISIYLILSMVYGFSQSDWAPVGAKWFYNHNYGSYEFLTVIESIGDTNINSKQCKILYTYEIISVMDSSGAYHWDTLHCPLQYTYQDSAKVFLYDISKNNFYTLYDFNTTSGDTITVVDTIFTGYCPTAYPFGTKFQYVIDSTTNIVIDSLTVRKQFVSPTQNSDWIITPEIPNGPTGNYPIIEKIGSTKFLFGVTKFQVMEGSIRCLRCYQDSSISFFLDWSDTIPCGYLPPLNINEINYYGYPLNIFPNPTTGILNIETHEKATLEFYNIEGQILKTIKSCNVKTTVDLSYLSSGIYIIKATTDLGIAITKFIKE
ncbi:T9SS type A sorting domain-containing protein [candidate division KSB1 bacterium]